MLWQIFIGHGSAWYPLLSACCHVEFDIFVICRVFMHCLSSFLLQDMLSNLHELLLRRPNMKFTVNMLLTCILFCGAGPVVIKTVCKYSRQILITNNFLFPVRLSPHGLPWMTTNDREIKVDVTWSYVKRQKWNFCRLSLALWTVEWKYLYLRRIVGYIVLFLCMCFNKGLES